MSPPPAPPASPAAAAAAAAAAAPLRAYGPFGFALLLEQERDRHSVDVWNEEAAGELLGCGVAGDERLGAVVVSKTDEM